MIPNSHFQALKKIVARLEGQPIPWVVTGSVGMALQGMPVEVHDIDLQTDRAGAYEIERLLAEYRVRPVRFLESERIRSHLGMLAIDGIQVEIMGELQKRLDTQYWEEPVRVETYRQWLALAGMQVPVLSLEYEYQSYLRMGRTERAAMLKAWLENRK